MKPQRPQITESLLNLSLIKSSDAIVREMSLASKKLSIYGARHPVAERALDRLIQMFKEAFKFKKMVTFNIDSGHLHVMNIKQRNIVFTDDVTRLLQSLEMRAVCFFDTMNQADLSVFVERLVKREKVEPHIKLVSDFLKKKNITTIEVNSELAHRLFEQNLKYRADIDRDFTVRQIALDQLTGQLLRLAEIYDNNEQALITASIDFQNNIVQFLIPEKIAAYNSDAVVASFEKHFSKLSSVAEQPLNSKEQKRLGRIISLHPDRTAIINALHSNFGGQVAALIRESVLPSVDEFPGEAAYALADFEEQFLVLKETDAHVFAELFTRYYRTGRRGQTIEIVDYLVRQLAMPDWHLRQKALHFLDQCLKHVDPLTDKFVLENLVVRLSRIIDAGTETLEHAELTALVLESGCHGRRFPIIAELVDALGRRKSIQNGVTLFDSLAVKAALMKLNRPEMLDYLIDELASGNQPSANIVQRFLIVIGTEEVARALVKIISHPSRQLRRHVLKILIELGRPALSVCTSLLDEKTGFERPPDRLELPDSKWYIIRNAIYVLGSLKDPAALESLRCRISDSDPRVKREIIAALEKIGGEEACDLLLLMAEDPSLEIRDLALAKLGHIGTPDSAPLVIDLLQRDPRMCVRCVQTIGQLGGEPGSTFLQLLLQDEHKSDDLTRGCIPKEEFKAAVIRALARFGDQHSLESIQKYHDSLTGTHKVLIKNTPLESALNEALNRTK